MADAQEASASVGKKTDDDSAKTSKPGIPKRKKSLFNRRRFSTKSNKHVALLSRKTVPFPRLGRTTSFTVADGDPNTDAAKAAAQGFDPFILLRRTQPEVTGMVAIRRGSSKLFSKLEKYWGEIRGHYVLLYTRQPSESEWQKVDISGSVSALFSFAESSVTRGKREGTLKVRKDHNSILLKFKSNTERVEWEGVFRRNMLERQVRLSDFEIIAPIGRGAAGKVFLVRDKMSDRKMALKCIAKGGSVFDSRSSYRHAVDERLVLGLTEGEPSFVQLRYAFQTRASIFLVTDFCDGGDLFYYLCQNDCGLDEDRARFIVAEIILAMEILHQFNVLYRDLKPENILLDAEGHVRIADFGLCKRLEKSIAGVGGRTGTICGTLSMLCMSVRAY